MKNYFSILTALCFATALQAQQTTPNDALRLTDKGLNGTARFKSMSGAFGAVGGDLSAFNINPAGSALFNHNMTSLSLGYNQKKNQSSYFGTEASQKEEGLELGQMGAAFVFNSRNPENLMKKFVIGINYESTKNLDNSIYAIGINPTNSISDYFLNFANYGNNGAPFNVNELQVGERESVDHAYARIGRTYGFAGQQAFLGYQEYLFDFDETDQKYKSTTASGPYVQENHISSSGYNGKLTGNFGSQLGERIFVGANLNLHFVDYTAYTSLYQNSQKQDALGVTQIFFQNEVYTYGNGFSFNLGGIAQLTDDLRVGLSYESPTWYRINDEMVQSLSTQWRNPDLTTDSQSTSPNVINTYETYTIQTPSSFTGSFAYLFGQKGLISVDYTFKDYSTTEMRPQGDFASINSQLSNELTNTSEVRIGGEYRIQQFSIRGGYRFEQSPYEKGLKRIGDLNSYSAGVGFDFGASRLDLAYAHASRSFDQTFISSSFNDAASVKSKENAISLTYSIKF